MTDVDPDITPAALPVGDFAPGPTPVEGAPACQTEPAFVVTRTSEFLGSGASTEIDTSPTTIDAPIEQEAQDLPDRGGMGGGRDGGPPAIALEPGQPENAIHYQTYHGDLLVLRDVVATMLPIPVATEAGVQVADTSVPCEVAPDGLGFVFCDGPVSCQVRVPFADGTMPSGTGRFQIPAQTLRLAVLQVVKNKPKPKDPSIRPQSSSRRSAPSLRR